MLWPQGLGGPVTNRKSSKTDHVQKPHFIFYICVFSHVILVKGKLSHLYCFVFVPGLENLIFYAGVQTKLARIKAILDN